MVLPASQADIQLNGEIQVDQPSIAPQSTSSRGSAILTAYQSELHRFIEGSMVKFTYRIYYYFFGGILIVWCAILFYMVTSRMSLIHMEVYVSLMHVTILIETRLVIKMGA